MMLQAFGQAAAAVRRHPYPFAATGLIALALNMLGLVHPILTMASSLFILPMLYTGLGTLAEAEPGLRFTQALRLALSAWPRMLALGGLMFLLLLGLSMMLGISLSFLYGDQLTTITEQYGQNPVGLIRALSNDVDWSQSAYGLGALGLLTLAAATLFWMAPMAMVHGNQGVVQSMAWSVRMGREHFASLVGCVLVWVLLSVLSGALLGLNVVLWPLNALFHFYCYQALGKLGG